MKRNKKMSEILNVGGSVRNDDSIVKKEYHTYTPYTQAYGNNDEIRINIQSQDLYILPSESYILLEVYTTFTRAAGAAANAVTFVNNFASFFFSEIRYELNGVEIDRCKNPGITANMKRYAAHRLDNLFQMHQIYENTTVAENRTYRFIVPLSGILGFADDYNKILMNAKHELILVRSRNDTNVYTGGDGATSHVNFEFRKVHWKIPHIQLSDQSKLRMLRYLDKKRTINMPFRSWELYEIPQLPQANKHIWTVKSATSLNKPRFIIVGFQTNRNNAATASSAHFDNCTISDIKLYLNNDVFPYNNLDTNFGQGNYQEIFAALLQIQMSYYGCNSYNPFSMTLTDFNSRPLFAFDCSRSDESLVNSTVDVRIEINARENIPANTTAFCLIIHDNIVTYSPFDGIINKGV